MLDYSPKFDESERYKLKRKVSQLLFENGSAQDIANFGQEIGKGNNRVRQQVGDLLLSCGRRLAENPSDIEVKKETFEAVERLL